MVDLPERDKQETSLLKGSDLKKTVTEAKIKQVDLSDQLRNKYITMQGKGYTVVLTLDGALPKKQLALNATNYDALRKAYGVKSERWIDKTISLIRVPRKNPTTGQDVQGIQVEAT